MTAQPKRYVLVISPTTRGQLAETLPETVAIAAHELIVGPCWTIPIASENGYTHPSKTDIAPDGEPIV